LKGARVRYHAESDMTKNAKEELERQRLDLELDRELEATFPASDALKITRRQRDAAFRKGNHPRIEKD
jgi:hypothetical protein